MVLRAHVVLCAFVSLFIITARPAGADPIRVTGRIDIDDVPIDRSVDVRLQIGDQDFFTSLSGEGDGGPRTIFFPAAATLDNPQNGRVVDLSSRLVLRPLFVVGDRLGDDTQYSANFTFTAAPSVLTRCGFLGAPACFSFSRFLFTGTLTGADLAGDPLFERDLSGSGEARALFQIRDAGGGGTIGRLRNVTYEFDLDPEPVPEPTTLLLLGTGLAGIGVRRWRKQP